KSQLERNKELLESIGRAESDLYSRVILRMLEESPTSYGYADYAATNYRLERFSIAAQYYQKALEVQQDSSSLDIWRYKLAVSYYGAKEYRKAFKSAKLVNGENEALALKLSGDCIALLASECGNSTFERNANYWLANDYYLKAKFLGLNVSGKEYLSNAPAATEVFEQGLKIGDAYYLDCWKVKTVIR
ncbi:MAG: tetratricopeptide (TPR) repeat protein, partial [Arenicella sp.]